MRRSVKILLAGTVFAVAATACTEPVDMSAEELQERLTSPEPQPMEIGEAIENRGVEVTIQSVEAMERSRESANRLRVAVRSENVGELTTNNPMAQIVCDENPAGGDWHEGSTWEPSRGIDAGVVLNGEVILGFPLKPDSVEFTVLECTTPRLRFIWGDRGRSDQAIGEYPIPESIIEDATKAPTGPPLPLETPSA